MNALSSNLPADIARAMARELLGVMSPTSNGITYHSMLPSLVTGEPLSLVDSTWTLGTSSGRHAHADEDEIIVVLSGTIEVRMGGQAFRFGPGQTGFVPRGMEHEVRAYTEARHIAILTRKGAEALPLAA